MTERISVCPGPIGVLGGMGPEATILLQKKLLDRVDAADDADHIPLLVDMNPQVPSRIAHLVERNGPSPGPVLVAMAERLARAGAVALAMPCNTAHAFAPDIRDAVDLPFLDMVAQTGACLSRAVGEGARVGILASPAVRAIGLYDAELQRRGLHAVWPSDDAPVLASIRAIKREGATIDSCSGLVAAAHALRANGADHLLVACTEFSLAMEYLPASIPATDALDALADAIVAFWVAHTSREAAL